MAVIRYLQKFGIRMNEVWFVKEEEKDVKNCDIVMYGGMGNPPEGYGNNIILRDGQTLLSDLLASEEDMFKAIEHNTRAKIKKGEKEDILIEFFDAEYIKQNPSLLKDFSEFYNSFVDSMQGSPRLKKKMMILEAYVDAGMMVITCAKHHGERIIYHAYLANGTVARLYASASVFRNLDEEQQKINSHANCLLHWKDMVAFKNIGYQRYDWGGYSTLESLRGINQFKRGFGGAWTKMYAYTVPRSLFGHAVVYFLRTRERILRRSEREA